MKLRQEREIKYGKVKIENDEGHRKKKNQLPRFFFFILSTEK